MLKLFQIKVLRSTIASALWMEQFVHFVAETPIKESFTMAIKGCMPSNFNRSLFQMDQLPIFTVLLVSVFKYRICWYLSLSFKNKQLYKEVLEVGLAVMTLQQFQKT